VRVESLCSSLQWSEDSVLAQLRVQLVFGAQTLCKQSTIAFIYHQIQTHDEAASLAGPAAVYRSELRGEGAAASDANATHPANANAAATATRVLTLDGRMGPAEQLHLQNHSETSNNSNHTTNQTQDRRAGRWDRSSSTCTADSSTEAHQRPPCKRSSALGASPGPSCFKPRHHQDRASGRPSTEVSRLHRRGCYAIG